MTKPTHECRFLFVYGTLRRGHGAEYKIIDNGGAFLSTEASCSGTRHGSIICTFDEPHDSTNRVDGHLVQLPDGAEYQRIMNILDRYEGLSESNDERGMYKRVIVDVSIPGHDFPIEAWAYHANIGNRFQR